MRIIIKSINIYLYLKIFLKYIQDFEKDRNFFYYELKELYTYLRNFKTYNIKEYALKTKLMLLDILNDKKSTKEIRHFIKNYLIY